MTTLKDAGESVRRRGFLDENKVQLLGQQLKKLREEVDEIEQSFIRGDIDPYEVADAIIVCSTFGLILDVDLDNLVAEKCRRDEARGIRHQGEPLPEQPWNDADDHHTIVLDLRGDTVPFKPYSWSRPSKLAMKAPSENGHCYRDFS
jgi:hypothetical protein